MKMSEYRIIGSNYLFLLEFYQVRLDVNLKFTMTGTVVGIPRKYLHFWLNLGIITSSDTDWKSRWWNIPVRLICYLVKNSINSKIEHIKITQRNAPLKKVFILHFTEWLILHLSMTPVTLSCGYHPVKLSPLVHPTAQEDKCHSDIDEVEDDNRAFYIQFIIILMDVVENCRINKTLWKWMTLTTQTQKSLLWCT